MGKFRLILKKELVSLTKENSEKILKKRMAKNIPMEELAKKIGIEESLLSKIESGRIVPSRQIVKKIEEILDIPLSSDKFGSDIKEFLGERIVEEREIKELTQRELAQRAMIGQSYLSKIESGKIVPSRQILEKIAKALNMTLKDMVEGTLSEYILQGKVEIFGPIAFCPNENCPAAQYILHQDNAPTFEGMTPIFMFYRYVKFPRYAEDGKENKYCQFCGTELISSCPKCKKAINSEEQKYCPGCGNKIFPMEKEIILPDEREDIIDAGSLLSLQAKWGRGGYLI